MPIEGIKQPQIIRVDDNIRLRAFDGKYDFAYAWYQDQETMHLRDGEKVAYPPAMLDRMYAHLDGCSELYFIELEENGRFRPIGDAAFSQWDMPVLIGEKALRGQHIGRKVIEKLIARGRELDYDELMLRRIYDHNPAALRCYQSAGFKVYAITADSSLMSILL